MANAAKAPPAAASGGLGRDLLAALLLAGCVWLMTQAALHGARQFLSPETNLRLAPRSSQALSDAAEAAQQRGQNEAAGDLARRSLAIAPFDARTVRVLGMTVAGREEDLADRLITLAGNWSLRDSPAHAWLILRRARQGNVASVLAHADLLLRRRPDLYDALFPIFDEVAAEPAGASLVAQRLLLKPIWRPTYFSHLRHQAAARLNVALALKDTQAPPDPDELAAVYDGLASEGRFDELKMLYRAMAGPAAPMLRDGDFPLKGQPEPLGWAFTQAPGFDVQVMADPDGAVDATVLDVRHDNFGAGVAAEQLLILQPGAWRLSGKVRWRTPAPAQPPTWTVTCVGGGPSLLSIAPVAEAGKWGLFSAVFSVPQGCHGQFLRLSANAGERRQDVEAEFDDLQVQSQ